MTCSFLPTLVLALGNDILGDDKVALAAAQAVRLRYSKQIDFRDSAEAGLAMLDIMSGYKRVLLLDSITTGRNVPGTVLEFFRKDFDKVTGPSPHYAGLPEVLALAKSLGIAFPEEIRILAMEIESPVDFTERLSDEITEALPDYVEKASQILQEWNC